MSGYGLPCGHCEQVGHNRRNCPNAPGHPDGPCTTCRSRSWPNGRPPVRVAPLPGVLPVFTPVARRGRGRGRGGFGGFGGRAQGPPPPVGQVNTYVPPPPVPSATRQTQDFVHTVSLSANTTNTTVTRLVLDETLAGLAAAVRGYELITMDSVWLELRISAQDTGYVLAYFANSRIGALTHDEIQNLSGSMYYTASNATEGYGAQFVGGGRGSRHLLSARRGQVPAVTLFYCGATSAAATLRIHFRLALQEPVQVTNITTPQVPPATRGSHVLRPLTGFGGLWVLTIGSGAQVRIDTSGSGAARTLQTRASSGGAWRNVTTDGTTVATVGNFPTISALFAAFSGQTLAAEFYGNISA